MPFAHKILLEDLKKKGKIKIEDLPTELQTVIKNFESREKLEQKQDSPEETMTALEADSWLIAQRIFDYHVEPEEQEVVLTPSSSIEEVHEAANEIIDEVKTEQEADITAGDDQQGNGVNPAVTAPVSTETAEVPVQIETPLTEESATALPATEIPQEPIATDPVAAAIAAGAVKPETEPSAASVAPIDAKPADVQASDDYQPKGEEAILHKLFTSGKKEGVSLAELKEAGINTGASGKVSALGASKFGRYKLTPAGMFTKKFDISFK